MTEHKEGHRKSAAHSARHLARVFVMLGLYQWLADPSQDYAGIEAHLSSLLHDEEEQLEGSDIRPTDFEKADRELFTKLLAGVLDRHAEVADAIARHADRELSRISLVERAVLMIGTYELMACPETPWRVILNESIELVKQFGSQRLPLHERRSRACRARSSSRRAGCPARLTNQSLTDSHKRAVPFGGSGSFSWKRAFFRR